MPNVSRESSSSKQPLCLRCSRHIRHLLKTVCYLLSCVRLFVTLRTLACQAPLSMRFSRQEYWSGLPFLTPEDLPNLGIKPGSLALQADSSSLVPRGKPKNSEARTITLILQLKKNETQRAK